MSTDLARTVKSIRPCCRCRIQLTSENWSTSHQKYKRYICKTCWNTRQKNYEQRYIAENPDYKTKRRAIVKIKKDSWDDSRKERERKRAYSNQLKKRLGIDITTYDRMLATQDGKCAICKTTNPDGKGSFHVDHDHETGKIRKLLCSRCNMMLGLAKDSFEILLNSVKYLYDEREDKNESKQ